MNSTPSPSVVSEAAVAGTPDHAAGSGRSASELVHREPTTLWNRNFGLLLQGQLISSIGKQAFALTCMLWLKELTGSGSLMGMLMTCSLLPAVFLGPAAGVFVDRLDRRKLIAWTDIAGGILVVAVWAALLLSGTNPAVAVAGLFVVATATGLLDAFSQPAIAASLPSIVPKSSLEAANGLNMGSVQTAVFLSQAGAGILYRILGAPLLVLLNGLTYLYAGISELFIAIPPLRARAHTQDHPWRRFRADFAEGLSFVWGNRGMRTMLLVFTLLNFFVAPILVILPFFVQDHLGLGPQWYGYVMATFGVGTLFGFAVMGTAAPRGVRRAAVMAASILIQSALILVMLLPMPAAVLLGLMALIGFTGGIQGVAIISLLQGAAPSHLQGRVQSLSTTMAMAIMPLGMGLGGILFDLSGQNVVISIAIYGSLTVLTAVLSLLSRDYLAFLASEPLTEEAGEVEKEKIGTSA